MCVGCGLLAKEAQGAVLQTQLTHGMLLQTFPLLVLKQKT